MWLPDSLRAWDTPDFKAVLKREVEAQGAAGLPLQQCLSGSSYALDDGFSVMIIGAGDTPTAIVTRLGVFYSGVVAGCNCADDPTPLEAQPEYCELALAIDKATAAVTVTPLAD
jgi:hypothetical protein